MAKRRKPRPAVYRTSGSARSDMLSSGKQLASDLIDRQRYEDALLVVQRLAVDYPEDPDVLMMLGICTYSQGDLIAAITNFERAYTWGRNPRALYPLGVACLQRKMLGSALHAFTESQRQGLPIPADMQPAQAQLRRDVGAIATQLHLPLERVIAGLRDMERATLLLDQGEYADAVAANRAAIKALGDWPPPHNNLAAALFFDGQVPAAIAECRQVLAQERANLQAGVNLVRFLAWSGERTAADEVWRTLRLREPQYLPSEALKLAEGAAIMDDDASIRRWLAPLAHWTVAQFGNWSHYEQAQRFLAIADANLRDIKAARMRLRALQKAGESTAGEVLGELAAKAGGGKVAHIAYFHSHDVMPQERTRAFLELAATTGAGDDPKAAKALKDYAARYPQLVLAAEKLIWEEDKIEPALFVLRFVTTPPAHAALRRFATSQAGSEKQRADALMYLQASGGVQPGEVLRFWRNGAWHEIAVQRYAIGLQPDQPVHKPSVARLIDRAQDAMREERWTDAAPLLRQAIELEPEAYDALNNLGVVLGKIGDAAAGRVLMAQALAIKPTYVFARVNLALGMIDGDVDGADALLAPLAALDVFSAQEFAFYQFGLAHVAVKREEFDQARNLLQMAISILPGYAPAVRLLATVEQLEQQSGDRELWESIRASSDQRSQRERSRQQARLTTLTPPVAEVVASYTAELLRPIARALRPTQGITGLRKAELQQLVTQTLLDPVAVAAIVGRALNDQERAALRAVLDAGGAMPRERFFDAYGDDRSELPWWNYKLPASVGGRLRLHLLLAEATVDGVVYTVAPVELREPVAAALGG